MATKGNYHVQWIYGSVEERVLLLAIITASLLGAPHHNLAALVTIPPG
jgi:hypothetical protein